MSFYYLLAVRLWRIEQQYAFQNDVQASFVELATVFHPGIHGEVIIIDKKNSKRRLSSCLSGNSAIRTTKGALRLCVKLKVEQKEIYAWMSSTVSSSGGSGSDDQSPVEISPAMTKDPDELISTEKKAQEGFRAAYSEHFVPWLTKQVLVVSQNQLRVNFRLPLKLMRIKSS